MKPRPSNAAFTLLEIMLAITILALLSTAVYATWNAGLSGWKRSASVTDSLQRERVVMETLAELTQSAMFFTSASGQQLYDVQGKHFAQTGDSVSFVTASDLLLPASESSAAGMRRVTIALSKDTRGRPVLVIANAPALEPEEAPEPVYHILSADVCGFAVRYRDPRNGSWTEEWNEQTYVPAAIEYTVAFGVNDGRTPPVIVTRTVDLPVAAFALQALGEGLSQQYTTNTVTRRDDIPLSESKDTGEQ